MPRQDNRYSASFEAVLAHLAEHLGLWADHVEGCLGLPVPAHFRNPRRLACLPGLQACWRYGVQGYADGERGDPAAISEAVQRLRPLVQLLDPRGDSAYAKAVNRAAARLRLARPAVGQEDATFSLAEITLLANMAPGSVRNARCAKARDPLPAFRVGSQIRVNAPAARAWLFRRMRFQPTLEYIDPPALPPSGFHHDSEYVSYLLSLWTRDNKLNDIIMRLMDGRRSVRVSELLRLAAANRLDGPAFAALTAGMLAQRSP